MCGACTVAYLEGAFCHGPLFWPEKTHMIYPISPSEEALLVARHEIPFYEILNTSLCVYLSA